MKREAEVNEEVAEEDHLFACKHSTEELCFCTRERDGSLHLGEPDGEAPVEEKKSS